MFWSIKSLTPLAATSIILAVTNWIVVCYSFVMNCIELMTLAMEISSKTSENIELRADVIAFIVIPHLIQILCETLMIAMLVVQFLSSLDFLTGNGEDYQIIWKELHRKFFPLNAIILAISLCIFFNSMNFYLIYEVSAILLNVLFLLTVIAAEIEGINVSSDPEGLTYNIDAINTTKVEKTPKYSSVRKPYDYNINICSFLESTSGEKKV